MSSFTEEYFRAQLIRQLGFIQYLCSGYDIGFIDLAILIATRLRVTFNHGSGSQKSLLQHLKASRTKMLTSTEGFSGGPRGSQHFGLGSFRSTSDGTSTTGSYGPKLGNSFTHEEISFHRWWKEQIVVVLDEDTQLTRMDIVLAATNTDGGAHVGRELPQKYHKLAASGVIGELVVQDSAGERRTPIENLHFKALRQIGYEVLHSPELLKLAGL